MSDGKARDAARSAVTAGRAVLGIELGSTRIKACLLGDDPARVIAAGGSEWENRLVDGRWTYPLEEVESAMRAAYADLAADVRRRYGTEIRSLAAIGVSAMMHGYLPFDADGGLLVPFRTWRNTSTGPAAAALSELFGLNVPLRWSVSHLYQAVLDDEPHVRDLASITTLAGYVHRRLGGRDVLGVGDASGVFPIDPGTHDYDAALVQRFDDLVADRVPALHLRALLPEVLVAGREAGALTEGGAAWLDPSGTLRAGAVLCPPEGDAGTGMVATGSVAPREGSTSIGTSVFAMVVLEGPLDHAHPEIDLVTTPAGDPVAMVHCNNGASELGAWVALFARFAEAAGRPLDPDAVFSTLLREALDSDPDAGGLIAFNTLAGEPITGLAEGRPLLLRAPDGRFTLGNLIRAQLYGVFGALSIGMRVLGEEGVRVERMLAHGGLLRTEGVAARFLANALDVPVAVGAVAAEGGAWGAAVLAGYTASGDRRHLAAYLREHVLAGATVRITEPVREEVEAYSAFLERYRAALPIERAAVEFT